MPTVTLASIEGLRSELVNSKYYLNIRSGYMAPVTLHCSYGDSGEEVTFYIFDGSEALSLDGASVTIHGTRIDGANFGPFDCTTRNNSVSFTLQSAMTAVEGSAIAEFSIVKNGTNVGTCNFGILVENSAFPNGVAYDSDPSVYQSILVYVQGLSAANKSDYVNRIYEEQQARITADSEEALLRSQGDATNADAINTQKARIDNYLSSGTAATNSELVDIRVAQDGKTYASAGTAVRTQVEWLKRNNSNVFDAEDIAKLLQNFGSYRKYNNAQDYTAGYEQKTGRPQFDTQPYPTKITGYDGETYALSEVFTVTEGTIFGVNYIPLLQNGSSAYLLDGNDNILWRGLAHSLGAAYFPSLQYIRIPEGCTKLVICRARGSFTLYTFDSEHIYKNDILPSYYYDNGYFDGKIAEVNNASSLVRNGTVFAFWTDPHLYGDGSNGRNSQHSKAMLKEVLKLTPTEFVICGGDIPAALGNENILKQAAITYIEYVKALDGMVFGVRGNHDFTIQDESDTSVRTTLSFAEYVSSVIRPIKYNLITNDPSNGYYYVDDIRAGIRFIFTNNYDRITSAGTEDIGPYMSPTQLNWIAETIISSSYDVIVVGHMPIDPSLPSYFNPDYGDIFNLLKAAKNHRSYNSSYDFSNFSGTLIAYFCGHCHSSNSATTDNLLSITTDSDSYWNAASGTTRNRETVTEQAFDIAVINKDTKTIDLIRFGGGVGNRHLEYV